MHLYAWIAAIKGVSLPSPAPTRKYQITRQTLIFLARECSFVQRAPRLTNMSIRPSMSQELKTKSVALQGDRQNETSQEGFANYRVGIFPG